MRNIGKYADNVMNVMRENAYMIFFLEFLNVQACIGSGFVSLFKLN